MSWFFILAAVAAVCAGSAVYLTCAIARFGFMKRIFKNGTARRAAAFTVLIAVICALYFVMGIMNTAVCIIHLMLIWLICDAAGRLIKCKKGDLSGYAALVLTALYLSWGAYNCFHVDVTRYEIHTDKPVGNIRVIQFADSHIGATFDGDGLNEYVEKMNAYEPDVVLITGDFVDDSTTLDEMRAACRALSRLNTKYGVYYTFGNHDKGYNSRERRGYGYEEIVNALTENGVKVLEDEAVTLDGRLAILGRQDYSTRGRMDMSALAAKADMSLYTIVMDHQPHDYANEQNSGVDMVLSGHTHGGQLIPINRVGRLIGENDMTYGHEKRGNTDFIVTSGISNWELWFKTGCKSEFVVIDIIGK